MSGRSVPLDEAAAPLSSRGRATGPGDDSAHFAARSSRQHEAGFTLLEALVALAILAGTAAAVLSLLVANRSLQAAADERLHDALRAEALLGQVGLDIPLNVGQISGLGQDGRSWSIAIAPFNDGGEPRAGRIRPLYEVVVRVPAGASSMRGVALRTLKKAPE